MAAGVVGVAGDLGPVVSSAVRLLTRMPQTASAIRIGARLPRRSAMARASLASSEEMFKAPS